MAKRYLVDEDGEILNEFEDTVRLVNLHKGDRVLTRKAHEYLTEAKEFNYPFVKVNYNALRQLASNETVWRLMECLSYPDNIVIYKNGVVVKQKDLHKLMPYSQRTVMRHLNELLALDVVKFSKTEKGEKCLVFNPFVATRVRKANIDLYNMFKDSKWNDNEQEE